MFRIQKVEESFTNAVSFDPEVLTQLLDTIWFDSFGSQRCPSEGVNAKSFRSKEHLTINLEQFLGRIVTGGPRNRGR